MHHTITGNSSVIYLDFMRRDCSRRNRFGPIFRAVVLLIEPQEYLMSTSIP